MEKCMSKLIRFSLSLIKELTEEVECLKDNNEHLAVFLTEARADTVRKYHDKVEELIEQADDVNPVSYWANDQIAKEMLEEKDGT